MNCATMNSATLHAAAPRGAEPRGAGPRSVAVIRDAAALAALKPEWDALWQRLPEAGLFARHAWFATWWQHFGAGAGALLQHRLAGPVALPAARKRLCVLTLRDSRQRLVGVLPWLCAASRWRRVPVTILGAALNAHAPRSGLLVAAEADLAQLWRAVCAAGDWDVLLCDGLADGQVGSGWLEALLTAAPLARSAGRPWRHLRLALEPDFEALLAARGSHFRKRERQIARTLRELGPVTVQCAREPAAVARAFEQFVAVDAASWKSGPGEALAAHPAVAAWYRDLCLRFAAEASCHVWVLHIGARPAAAFLVLLAGPVAHLLKVSHVAALASARHAPARVLLGRVLETYCAEGLAALDFTGDMPFVERWSASGPRFAPRALFAPTWRGWCAARAERLVARVGGCRRASRTHSA